MAKLPIGFEDKYTANDAGCWLWSAYKNPAGYGRVRVKGRNWLAHRLAWTVLVGEIPDGMVIDHYLMNGGSGRCSRACVNPEHMEVVTQGVNARRGIQGLKRTIKTECRRGHEYTEANTYISPGKGLRQCRTCLSLIRRRRYLRDKGEA